MLEKQLAWEYIGKPLQEQAGVVLVRNLWASFAGAATPATQMVPTDGAWRVIALGDVMNGVNGTQNQTHTAQSKN